MRILCTGLSHKTANVATREKLAFDEAGVIGGLESLRSAWGEAEFVIVSTCNRTEVYTARPVHGHPREEELCRWLGEYRGVEASSYASAVYTLTDADAWRHLFALAGGLDSLVPGESQIVAQLKAAYAAAVGTQTARKVMNELFQAAFRTAKRVRSETDIGAGKVSVASVAVDAAVEKLGALAGKCVLNIGAGKMNEIMLRYLSTGGPGQILIANRSPDKAEQLAAACGGKVANFDRLQEHLSAADVVLSSTASSTPLLTRRMVQAALKKRPNRPLLIVDIAVPRDVEARVGELDGAFLYNIDDLEAIVGKALQLRHDQSATAEKIIDEEADKIRHQMNIRGVSPTLEALYQHMENIAEEELAEAKNKLSSHDDAAEDARILQRALHRTIRRILHPAAKRLRKEAGSDTVRSHIAALRKLFDLDET